MYIATCNAEVSKSSGLVAYNVIRGASNQILEFPLPYLFNAVCYASTTLKDSRQDVNPRTLKSSRRLRLSNRQILSLFNMLQRLSNFLDTM
jgi:hypothetical protein